MYFLKCSKCGHYNEVKSEYLVFCSHCNKKLDNNYSDWVVRNPEKSFYDFKQLVCTTTNQDPKPTKEKSNHKISLKYGIIFALSFAIFYAIGHFAGDAIVRFFKNPSYDVTMMEVANQINKSCPFMVDSETRLDNAIALPNNVFQYNYTLINLDKSTMDIVDLENKLGPTIVNFVKTNPDLKPMRDLKTTINYYYKDRAGNYLFTISVKPNQYE